MTHRHLNYAKKSAKSRGTLRINSDGRHNTSYSGKSLMVEHGDIDRGKALLDIFNKSVNVVMSGVWARRWRNTDVHKSGALMLSYVRMANPYIDGILPKWSYPPCLSMAYMALLAEYPWHIQVCRLRQEIHLLDRYSMRRVKCYNQFNFSFSNLRAGISRRPCE